MKIKRILAWLLVILVGYVVLYCYMHPEELVYRDDSTAIYDVESDIPLEPLVKQKNPFVYFILQNQGWFFLAGIVYAVLDKKGNERILENLKTLSRNWKNKAKLIKNKKSL